MRRSHSRFLIYSVLVVVASVAAAQSSSSAGAPAQGQAKATIITDPSALPPQNAAGAPQSSNGAQGPAAPQGDDNASSHMPAVGNQDTLSVPAQGAAGQEATQEGGVFVFKKQVEEVILH